VHVQSGNPPVLPWRTQLLTSTALFQKTKMVSSSSSSAMANSPTLLGLPVELRRYIVEYIRAIEDLRSLCLTCTALQDVASRMLYQHINLSSYDFVHGLDGSLNTSNRQLKHMRTLEMEIRDDYAREQAVRLIQALPDDSLIEFSTVTDSPVDRELDIIVRKRQRRLRNMLMRSYISHQDLQGWMQAHNLQNITELRLVLEAPMDVTNGNEVLTQLPNLQQLSIVQNMSDRRDIFGTLFAAWQTEALRIPKLSLRSLAMDGVDCRHAAYYLQHAIDFNSLSELHLKDCNNVCDFLDRLGQEATLKLEHLHVYLTDSVDAFDTSLGSFTGLRTLQLLSTLDTEYDKYGLNYWKAIQAHGPSLRELEIWDHGTKDYLWESVSSQALAFTRQISAHCSRLRHLSLLAPPIATFPDEKEPFQDFIGCLKQLRELEILKLRSWPHLLDPEDEHGYIEDEKHVNDTLELYSRQAADNIFSTLYYTTHLRALLMIALSRDNNNHLFGFYRQVNTDPWGNRVVQSLPVGLLRLGQEEPGSRIKDFPLLVLKSRGCRSIAY
jgi:hypothetical protein